MPSMAVVTISISLRHAVALLLRPSRGFVPRSTVTTRLSGATRRLADVAYQSSPGGINHIRPVPVYKQTGAVGVDRRILGVGSL